jgi:hypothetical protein
LATAALRGLLVVAALALGFFVLSKAFPSGSDTPAGTPGEPAITTSSAVSPTVTPSPTRQIQEPSDPSDISVQVLNGTEVAGLAGDTADILGEAGYDVKTVGDAETAYETTTIFYVPKRKVDAQLLQQAFFPTAVLEVAEEDVKVDVTVILGSDYADSLEGGATPSESPS